MGLYIRGGGLIFGMLIGLHIFWVRIFGGGGGWGGVGLQIGGVLTRFCGINKYREDLIKELFQQFSPRE